MSKYKEGKVEQYLVQQVEKRGGKAYKWVSPGRRGVPDRIIVLPQAMPIFAEIKDGKARLDPVQQTVCNELTMLDQDVWLLDSVEAVNELIAVWDASFDRITKH